MEITFKDKGEFLRGFLILIRKDKQIDMYERNMAITIGKYFGFEKEFCEESVDYLLENEYISEEPPIFSNKVIAEYFVRESYNIISQIHPLQEPEKELLRNILIHNDINQSNYNEINF